MGDIGRDFEDDWAKRTGGKTQPGSGNKWYARMDVSDSVFLWSLKATGKRSFPVSIDLVEEVVTEVAGMGATRADAIPGIAIRLGNDRAHDLVVMRADDFVRLVTEERKYIVQSKADAKRARAAVPQLLRDE